MTKSAKISIVLRPNLTARMKSSKNAELTLQFLIKNNVCSQIIFF